MVVKGKNGYFKYAGNAVSSLGHEILVQLNSKRPSLRNLAPVVIQGTRQEVTDLLAELLDKARSI